MAKNDSAQKRGSSLPGYESTLDRYLLWSATSPKEEVIKKWAISSVLAIAIVVAANFIPFGGSFVQAFFCVPSAVVLYFVLAGFNHRNHFEKDTPTKREEYSPARRRKLALILAAILVVVTAFGSTILPYTVGGTLMIMGVLALLNFVRLTPEEQIREEEGLLDPRDALPENLVAEEAYEELEELLEEDEIWVSSDENLTDIDLPEENSSTRSS